MILITSGDYVQEEFRSEIGLIPPCFLPIGNKRLYEFQVEMLRKLYPNDVIYLSVPSEYQLTGYDDHRLKVLNVSIIKTPIAISLSESIAFCWNKTEGVKKKLTILHGDTMFLNSSFESENSISLHPNEGFYNRALLGESFDKRNEQWVDGTGPVVSGFFSFHYPNYLIELLDRGDMNFGNVLNEYHRAHPFSFNSSGEWLDLGHINTFYQSRSRLTTQRSFNHLSMSERTVTKRSLNNPRKILAELEWFENIPRYLRLYTPAVLDYDNVSDNPSDIFYQLEYLYVLPLADIFVFGRVPKVSWSGIFESISNLLKDFAKSPGQFDVSQVSDLAQLYLPKTISRLLEFDSQVGFGIDSREISYSDNSLKITLLEMARQAASVILPICESDFCVIHGDLCFSNILFDSRGGAVKVVDPRGELPSGEFSIYGDRRYDLAKLHHSVIGLYDLIIAGHYDLEVDDESRVYKILFHYDYTSYSNVVDEYFRNLLVPSGYSEKEITAICVLLFLSMLPLHSDRPDRQNAFIANALRLHLNIFPPVA